MQQHQDRPPSPRTRRHYLRPEAASAGRHADDRREPRDRERREREELARESPDVADRELQEGITRRREREAREDELK